MNLSESYKKRLQELADIHVGNNEFIYHGTNDGAAYHMQKHGGMKLNAANNNEPYISFTSDLKVAGYYAEMKGGKNNGVILRIIKTPDFILSPKFKRNRGFEWITKREIPIKEIEVETKEGWVPLERWDIIDKKVIQENNYPDMDSMFSKYKLRYPKDDVLIKVNINKLLARHMQDEPNYAFDTKDTSDHPGRVDRAKEFWNDFANDSRYINPKTKERTNWGNATFEAPYVTIENGKLGFSDGRHRTIAMKELGYDDIIIEVPKLQVKLFDELLESKNQKMLNERTLYHGTIIQNVPSIEENGLMPTIGEFVKNSYAGAVDDDIMDYLEEILYATDKNQINKAKTAIIYQIANRLGKTFHSVTNEEFEKYGALAVVKNGDKYFDFHSEEDADWGSAPVGVETGDYYTRDEVVPDYILTGKKLTSFFKRLGMYPIKKV